MKKIGSLKEKTFKGGIFVFSYRVLQQFLNLIRLVILGRILGPKDFGIAGIALLTITIVDTFTQTGISQALIQKKEEVDKYLNDAWTFLVLRGIFLSIFLLISSSFIGNFFNSNESINAIRVLSIYFLFQSSLNIGVVVLWQRELQFKIFFIYQFIGIITEFFVSIFFALIFKNFWALIFGTISKSFVLLITSFLIHPYKPKFAFNIKILSPLISFGKWILISNIILFFLNQGGDIIIGKILGAYFLGLYQVAFRISNLPTTEITWAVSQVVFPAYSRIQEIKEKLKKGYLQTFSIISIFAFIFTLWIIIFGNPFVKIFLGEKWIEIILPMKILALWGFLRAHSATTGPFFQAIGKPYFATLYQFIRLLIFGIIVYPFTKFFGIVGTSLAILTSAFFVDIFAIFHVFKIIESKIKEIFEIFLPSILSSFISFIFIIIFEKFFISNYNIFNFFIIFFLFTFLYIFSFLFFINFLKNENFLEIKNLFLKTIK